MSVPPLPALVLALALTLPGSALAEPPRTGVLVPGRSLGGLELDATPAQVRAAWGSTFGRCRDCRRPTWYFNFRPFRPQGAGVELRRGRIVAVFTLWQPTGWRTSRGIALGENVARVTAVYGALARTECGLYSAFTLPSRAAVTAFYVRDGALWGFGLSQKGIPVCR